MHSSLKRQFKTRTGDSEHSERRRDYVHRIRKDERERTVSLKRRLALAAAGIDEVTFAKLTKSPCQVREILHNFRLAVSALKDRMVLLSDSDNNYVDSSQINDDINEVSSKLHTIRVYLSLESPPINGLVQFGLIDLLKLAIDFLEAYIQLFHFEEIFRNESIKAFLAEVEFSIAAFFYAEELDLSNEQVNKFVPFLVKMYHCCTEVFIEKYSKSLQTEDGISSVYEILEATTICLGNQAVDHPLSVLHIEGLKGSTLREATERIIENAMEEDAFNLRYSVIFESLKFLSFSCKNLKMSSFNATSELTGTKYLLGVCRSIIDLMTNILRNGLKIVPKAMIQIDGERRSLSSLLTVLINAYIRHSTQPGEYNLYFLDPVVCHCVYNLLWCWIYIVETDSSLSCALNQKPEVESVDYSDTVLNTLFNLLVCKMNHQSRFSNSPTDGGDDENELNTNLDVLFPSSHLFAQVLSSLTHSATNQNLQFDNPVNYFVPLPEFTNLLKFLMSHNHRGVVRSALGILEIVAIGAKRENIFLVKSFIPQLYDILNSAAGFDIKRGIISTIYEACHADECRYIDLIFDNNDPNCFAILPQLVLLFETCKFDSKTVINSLNFLELILEKFPSMRRTLYDMNIIEIIESVQHIHDELIFKKVSKMIERYFDDISDDEMKHQK